MFHEADMVEETLKEFQEKLAPCIEKGDLDVCVDRAVKLAQEMEIASKELKGLFYEAVREYLYDYVYVLSLATAQDLEGPEKASAYLNAGAAAQYIGELKKSEKYYKKAIELNPRDPIVRNNYATLLQDLGRRNEAEDQYKKAILYDEKFADAHTNYAILLREGSRFSDAEKEARSALQIDQCDPFALETLANILADEGYFEEARGKHQAALWGWPASMNNSMKSMKSEIHNNLGWTHAKLKQYNLAKQEFKEAVELDSLNVKAIRNLRLIEKAEYLPEISNVQKMLSLGLLVSFIISLYLFWISKLPDDLFVDLTIFLTALITFVLLFHELSRFRIGPHGIEFERNPRYIKPKPEFESSARSPTT
jgi:tetratricopeptide (TPR) repeat protein